MDLSFISALDGLLWFAFMLVPLNLLQRALHRELQAVFLISTRHESVATWMFSILFFPGVVMHELSHFLMAKILRVRTGHFSLIPRPTPDGRLQLGYVETAKTDIVRDSIVGLAPLIAGGLFVAYAAIQHLHLLPLWDFFRAGNFTLFWMGIQLLPKYQDFWLWFYLTFAISSTMLPSQSDRHAWLPLGILAVALLVLAIIAGAGPWMLKNLAPPLNNFLRAVASLFGLSVVVHLLLLGPLALFHRLLTRLTGLDVK